ncbi:hypothetical protein F4825DRAFT_405789 [Nemania diffusa]|nr:hypothetical protein F4825DRAFT_405789 [Nemania diffusa]
MVLMLATSKSDRRPNLLSAFFFLLLRRVVSPTLRFPHAYHRFAPPTRCDATLTRLDSTAVDKLADGAESTVRM